MKGASAPFLCFPGLASRQSAVLPCVRRLNPEYFLSHCFTKVNIARQARRIDGMHQQIVATEEALRPHEALAGTVGTGFGATDGGGITPGFRLPRWVEAAVAFLRYLSYEQTQILCIRSAAYGRCSLDARDMQRFLHRLGGFPLLPTEMIGRGRVKIDDFAVKGVRTSW